MPVEIIELPQSSEPAGAPVAPPPRAAAAAARIYLATPCFGCRMAAPFVASVLALHAECASRGIELLVNFIGNESLVERARNIMAARFLESDATHLLFVDADIGFRPDTVFRLLGADKDVVTAVYPKKAFDWEQVRAKAAAGDPEPVYQAGLDFNINIAGAKEEVTDGFLRVLDAATGFMMIKRRVLERMADAYRAELYCRNDIQGQPIKDYVALFACMIDPDTKRFLSEDFSFCRRWQQLGGEIWADLASPLAHVGAYVFSGDVRRRPDVEPPALEATTPAAVPGAPEAAVGMRHRGKKAWLVLAPDGEVRGRHSTEASACSIARPGDKVVGIDATEIDG